MTRKVIVAVVVLGWSCGGVANAPAVDTGAEAYSVVDVGVAADLSSKSCTFTGFAAPFNCAAGPEPTAIAVADFNGDGLLDLAVIVQQGSLEILLNQGGGSFAVQDTYLLGALPGLIATGDFNGDGKPDVAITNPGSNSVSVLLNIGDGTFSPQTTYATGTSPAAVAVADFNGDGLYDLVVTNLYDNNISVLFNAGNGTFVTQATYATAQSPATITTADFNGDGLPDLATVNSNMGNVDIMINAGDGVFNTQSTVTLDGIPGEIRSGLFEGSSADLTVTIGTSSIGLLHNFGNGTFGTMSTYEAGVLHSGFIATGDFNNDGLMDIVEVDRLNNSIGALLNGGNVTFGAPVVSTYSYPIDGGTSSGGLPGPQPIQHWFVVADFNNDGLPDLAITNSDGDSVSILLDQCN